jgi:hypothetical protein
MKFSGAYVKNYTIFELKFKYKHNFNKGNKLMCFVHTCCYMLFISRNKHYTQMFKMNKKAYLNRAGY